MKFQDESKIFQIADELESAAVTVREMEKAKTVDDIISSATDIRCSIYDTLSTLDDWQCDFTRRFSSFEDKIND